MELPMDPQTVATITALGDERRIAILLKVGEKPGVTFLGLSKELGIPKRPLAYGLGILYSEGFVAQFTGKGNDVMYRLTEKGIHWHKRLLVDAAILGPSLRR